MGWANFAKKGSANPPLHSRHDPRPNRVHFSLEDNLRIFSPSQETTFPFPWHKWTTKIIALLTFRTLPRPDPKRRPPAWHIGQEEDGGGIYVRAINPFVPRQKGPRRGITLRSENNEEPRPFPEFVPYLVSIFDGAAATASSPESPPSSSPPSPGGCGAPASKERSCWLRLRKPKGALCSSWNVYVCKNNTK